MSAEIKITRKEFETYHNCFEKKSCNRCVAENLCRALAYLGYPETLISDLVINLWDDLDTAVSYLRQGKAQFAPGTTNSLVDDFLARMDAQQAGRTITLSEES